VLVAGFKKWRGDFENWLTILKSGFFENFKKWQADLKIVGRILKVDRKVFL